MGRLEQGRHKIAARESRHRTGSPACPVSPQTWSRGHRAIDRERRTAIREPRSARTVQAGRSCRPAALRCLFAVSIYEDKSRCHTRFRMCSAPLATTSGGAGFPWACSSARSPSSSASTPARSPIGNSTRRAPPFGSCRASSACSASIRCSPVPFWVIVSGGETSRTDVSAFQPPIVALPGGATSPAGWCNAAQRPTFQVRPTSGYRVSAPPASLADAFRRRCLLEREPWRVGMHDRQPRFPDPPARRAPGFPQPLSPGQAMPQSATDSTLLHARRPRQLPGRTRVLPLYRPSWAQAAEVL
jgi:hypothetical protein